MSGFLLGIRYIGFRVSGQAPFVAQRLKPDRSSPGPVHQFSKLARRMPISTDPDSAATPETASGIPPQILHGPYPVSGRRYLDEPLDSATAKRFSGKAPITNRAHYNIRHATRYERLEQKVPRRWQTRGGILCATEAVNQPRFTICVTECNATRSSQKLPFSQAQNAVAWLASTLMSGWAPENVQ